MKECPKCALESDPIFGWIMIITFSLLLPFPFAVISMLFEPLLGPAFAGALWLGMCLAFPIWAIQLGYKPFFEERK